MAIRDGHIHCDACDFRCIERVGEGEFIQHRHGVALPTRRRALDNVFGGVRLPEGKVVSIMEYPWVCDRDRCKDAIESDKGVAQGWMPFVRKVPPQVKCSCGTPTFCRVHDV